jgi:hypothetical protein
MDGRSVFLVTLVSTVFCAAVNAYTLLVAYPLWRYVGPGEFQRLHKEYLRRLWPVITLPHVVMFFASAGLIWQRPMFVPMREAAALFALNGSVVVVSAFLAGPIHSRFEQSGALDTPGLRGLLQVSVVRVALMAASVALLCVQLLRAMRTA